jgi:hypothetical protein
MARIETVGLIVSIGVGIFLGVMVILFLIGIFLNLILGLLLFPEIVQIAGSTARNLGLMGIGVELMRSLQDSAVNGAGVVIVFAGNCFTPARAKRSGQPHFDVVLEWLR